MELLQHSIAALPLHTIEAPEKCKHTGVINLNTEHKSNTHKNSYSCQHSPNPPLLKLLEESSQTSVVTQLDLNENNAILLQGRLSS